MRAGDGMVFAEAGVGLSGVLCCQQIVGYRDDGEEEQDEEGENDKLLAAADTGWGGKAEPEGQNRGCQQHPREIETQLHVQARFYIKLTCIGLELEVGGGERSSEFDQAGDSPYDG